MINTTKKDESLIESDKEPDDDEKIVNLTMCEPQALG